MRSNWKSHVARAGNAKRAIDSTAVTDAARSEPADPFIRTQIHVAAGMAAVQLAVSTGEARLPRIGRRSRVGRASLCPSHLGITCSAAGC